MKRLLQTLCLVALGGCAGYSDLHQEAKPIALAVAASAVSDAWWPIFGDQQLDKLVDRALSGSPDIRIAEARVRQAEALADFVGADNSVQITAAGSASRQKISKNGMVPPPFAGATLTASQLTLDFSYDFDFWNRNRHAQLAAQGDADALKAETAASRLILSSAICKVYFRLQRNFEQLALQRRLLQTRSQLLRLLEAREATGIEAADKIRHAEQELARQKLALSLIDEEIKRNRHQLAALSGQSALDPIEIKPSAQFDPPNPERLAADRLGLRPDILAQRLQIEAATERAEVAKAEFYPNINLSALAGFQSIGINQLLKGGSAIAQFGPAINLPIYGGGRLRANLRARYADYDIAVERYNRTVLDAMREVADASTELEAADSQLADEAAAVKSLQAARHITDSRYRAGLIDSLSALQAELPLIDELNRQAEISEKRRQSLVALIRAYGGHANQVPNGK